MSSLRNLALCGLTLWAACSDKDDQFRSSGANDTTTTLTDSQLPGGFYPGGMGPFGLPACLTQSDCNGFCIAGTCAPACGDGCPEGLACRNEGGVEGCFPVVASLCEPCSADSECGGERDACVKIGDQSVCAMACDADSDCPEGYGCSDATAASGGATASKQCVPKAGTCECSEATLGNSLGCSVPSAFGACSGERVCTVAGWGACSAAQALPELCDGRDNDCDGVNDEGFATCDPSTDTDGDGIPDSEDSCPYITDREQGDFDKDGIGDACDPDDDGDGVGDTSDNCVYLYNVKQFDVDGDGLGDSCDNDIDDDGAGNDPALDCNPFDKVIYLGAEELCDGKDNDCDTRTDEGYPDTDGDKFADCIDPPGHDDDGDGLPESIDNCPTIANADQRDLDNDLAGDACDICPADPEDDLDNDGHCHSVDNCPTIANEFQEDLDRDDLGDFCDPDDDEDGDPDLTDCAPRDDDFGAFAPESCDGKDDNCDGVLDDGFPDTDLDRQMDCVDADDDNDTIPDGVDNCSLVANQNQLDSNANGQGDVCDPDRDGDTVVNEADNCPDHKNRPPPPATPGGPANLQSDLDEDGLGEPCDDDDDGDGLPDLSDNCPLLANANQANADADALGDVCDTLCPNDPLNDADADRICGRSDNCPTLANASQDDTDTDGLGDACDACPRDSANTDADLDGVCDSADNCPALSNAAQLDTDTDGQGDSCDLCPKDSRNDLDDDGACGDIDVCPFVYDPPQVDTDSDGVGDDCDICPRAPGDDTDLDGVCDDDDNCANTRNANQADLDQDGLGDLCDADRDGDTILNPADNCPDLGNADQLNSDADPLGDVCDADDDNDSIPDLVDNCPFKANPTQEDHDRDGLGDACDATPGIPGGGGGGLNICGDGYTDAAEDCDEGTANSDFAPDMCRLTCKDPRCGDGVRDTGEACDDGNTLESDGCTTLCTGGIMVGLPLPYSENFDTRADFRAAHWILGTDLASASNNWRFSTTGPLGPDAHAFFTFYPLVTNFEDTLRTPVLDASGTTHVTLSFSTVFIPSIADPNLELAVLASSDGGASWQDAWVHKASDGKIDSTTLDLDLSPFLAGRPLARLAFRVRGTTSGSMVVWAVDDVLVRSGAPPKVSPRPVPLQVVAAGDTLTLTLAVSDADAGPSPLNVSLVNSASFITLDRTDLASGLVDLVIAPPVTGALGLHGNNRVAVTDGQYTTYADFSVLVATPLVIPEPTTIVLRTQGGGLGAVLGPKSLVLGQSLTAFAAGYDSMLNYLGDIPVMWSSTGSLDPVAHGPASSFTFRPTLAPTSGTLAVTHPKASGETGLIDVAMPPPAVADPSRSTITADRNTLLVSVTPKDKTMVRVTLFDALGRPVTEPKAVVLSTNLGTLLGTLTARGNGVYEQELEVADIVGVATLSATVDGVPLATTKTVRFVIGTNLLADGVDRIVCQLPANPPAGTRAYADFMDKHLVVRPASGKTTVSIDADPSCAPMSFGSITIESGGIVTHSVGYTFEVAVDAFNLLTGGKVDVSKKGYGAGLSRNALPVMGAQGIEGGSYGGWGGNTDPSKPVSGMPLPNGAPAGTATSGRPYGDLTDPRFPGAGAARQTCSYVSSGPRTDCAGAGGLARITVRDGGFMVLNGILNADGYTNAAVSACSYADHSGGPSGGGVYIRTPHLSGTGSISAKGGNGFYTTGTCSVGGPSLNQAAGSGGRIAIVDVAVFEHNFAPDKLLSNVTAQGGRPPNSGASEPPQALRGAAGTIFVRAVADNYGRVFVDNKNVDASNSTPLISVSPGVVDRLDPRDVITDLASEMVADYYRGYRMKARRDEGAPTLTDDSQRRIVSNDDQNFSLSATIPASAGAEGDTYGGLHIWDELGIYGGAIVEVRDPLSRTNETSDRGDLLVLRGDGDATADVFDIRGQLKARVFELASVGKLKLARTLISGASYTVGGLDVVEAVGGLVPGYPWGLELDGAAFVKPNLRAASIDMTNAATLTVQNLDVNTDVKASGSTLTINGDLNIGRDLELNASTLSGTGLEMSVRHVTATNSTLRADTLVARGDIAMNGNVYDVNTTTALGDVSLRNVTTATVGLISAAEDLIVAGATTMTLEGHGLSAGGHMQLGGASLDAVTVTTLAATSDKVYPARFVANTLALHAGAKIDVSGKGFLALRGAGNSTTFGAKSNAGGSHGGLGDGVDPGRAFDKYFDPTEPGAGSGCATASGGGAGGGVIAIDVVDNVNTEGQILANGGLGAAGGSVRIEGRRLGGTGDIQAAGGTGNATCKPGGGGRVAFLGQAFAFGTYDIITSSTKVDVSGGPAGHASHKPAGAGTLFTKAEDDTLGTLLLDNRGKVATTRTPLLGVGAYGKAKSEGLDGQFDSQEPDALTDIELLWPNSTLAGYEVALDLGPEFDTPTLVDDIIVPIVDNASFYLQLDLDALPEEVTLPYDTPVKYRPIHRLDALVLRGRAELEADGDLLVATVDALDPDSTTLELDGIIEAYRLDIPGVSNVKLGTEYPGGIVADAFVTQGSTGTRLGWEGQVSSLILDHDIAVTSMDLVFSGGTVTVGDIHATGQLRLSQGGTFTSGDLEGPGLTLLGTTGTPSVKTNDIVVDTLAVTGASLTAQHVTVKTSPTVLLTNASTTVATLSVPRDLTLVSSSMNVTDHDVTVGRYLHLQTGSSITHPATTVARGADPYTLEITARSVIVDTGASIDVSGKGYPRETGYAAEAQYGPNSDGNFSRDRCNCSGFCNSNFPRRRGGAHAGVGGYSSTIPSDGPTAGYGHYARPMLPGSHGGGGVVHVVTTHGVAVNGAILANGSDNPGSAGGSVFLEIGGAVSGAGGLSGSGTISANGVSGTFDCESAHGGGSGGRVAIVDFQDIADNFRGPLHAGLSAAAGAGLSAITTAGAAGTIYLKNTAKPYGTLIIDNKTNGAVAQNWTMLTAVGTGVIDYLDPFNAETHATTLVDLSHQTNPWLLGFYDGTFVNPDISRVCSGTGCNQLEIVEQRAFELFFGADVDLKTMTGPGKSYRGVAARLDRLQLRGNAKLRSPGELTVLEGDLDSLVEGALALPTGTAVSVPVLDIGNRTTGTVTGPGTWTVGKYRCASCPP